MSAGHTEGRLVVGELNGHGIELKHTNGDVTGAISLVLARVTARPTWLAEAEANASRLAACWNAFDGVPTDKIEGKSVAEYIAHEAYITGLVPAPAGGMELGLSGDACQLLAESFAGQFKGSGGINFIEVQMRHKEMGPFTVTIQRQHGETPAQQKAAALRELAAARALLVEMARLDDEESIYTTEWDLTRLTDEFNGLTRRIHAFLEEPS